MPNSFIQIVDTAVADAYHRGGPHLVCHPGCSHCCIGVFPIAHEDAARLREGLTALEQSDPSKAARIHARVAQSLTRSVAARLPGVKAGESFAAKTFAFL